MSLVIFAFAFTGCWVTIVFLIANGGPVNLLTDGTVCIRIVELAPLFGIVCCGVCGPTCSKRYWPFSVFNKSAEPGWLCCNVLNVIWKHGNINEHMS